MCSTKLSHVGESHVQSTSHTFYSDGMLKLETWIQAGLRSIYTTVC